MDHNHIQHRWRLWFSFKNATIAVTIVNVIIFLFILQGLFTSSSSSHPIVSAQFRYAKEAEQIRLAMQPLELIKRVREIEEEVSAGQVTEQQKDVKQNTAVDLSKRLKDSRVSNHASSLKALEEWQKRKMERARQRDLEKNGGVSSIKT